MKTWKDEKHKLEWQVELPGSMTWNDSMEYANSLSDGWRLPTIEELETLLDRSKFDPAMREEVPFKIFAYYWSSTTYADSYAGNAWYVGFYNGCVYYDDKSSNHYVRCVRDLV